MGKTVVEPVRVRVSVCAAAPAGVDVAGVAAGEVVPLLVHPATNIDTMSNAARLTVARIYELRLVFMVFDHYINWS
jgi:hypothetical protein